jgi:UDP-GlcNAc:undecaprenyl-phosphate GlcNAc-1-phosphate transferase
LFIGSFLLSVILTAASRAFAIRIGFVAQPTADRYHQYVIPLGGGIAIFGTLAVSILAAIISVKFFVPAGFFDWLGPAVIDYTQGFLGRINELIIILGAAAVLFALGLWDDKKRLGPCFKLIVQFAAAITIAAFADVRVEFFIESKLVTTILSALWIVFLINAFNFLDNMDGACAGIAAITCSILFVAAALSGQVFVGGLALIFIGTLAGFLVFNFPPAKIFMGDAGSLVVGFFTAVLTLKTTYYQQAFSGRWHAVFFPLLCMAVPLYDFLSVTLLRISQGKSPLIGDTQHFSHRLKKRGLTETQTVLTLYLATLCTGLGAVFLYQVDFLGAILIFIQTFMVLAIIAILEATGRNDAVRG